MATGSDKAIPTPGDAKFNQMFNSHQFNDQVAANLTTSHAIPCRSTHPSSPTHPSTAYGKGHRASVHLCPTTQELACPSRHAPSSAMWRQSLNNVDPVAGSAGAAAVCALVSQHLHSRQAELSSELICWAALPFIFAFAKQSGLAASGTRATLSGSFRPQATTTSLGSVWIVALCVVLVSVYRQEIGAIASLPALVPLLLMAEKRFRSVAQFSRMLDSWSPSPLVQSVGASAVIGLLASLTLAEWCLRPLFYSAAPAAALYILYAALIPRDPDLPSLFPHLDLEDAVIPLSAHTVVISIAAMILRTIVLGFPSSGVMSTLFLGLAKALSWYFTTQTTRYTSWTIAAAVSTYALFSSADLALLPSDGQALTFSIISFLSLSQVIHMLPRQSKARVFLWLLCLASLIPYLSNLSAIRHARTSAPTNFGTHAHPVDALIQRARADFGAVLRNQSTSLSAAQDEYRRRYRRDPPPGFDAWYDFAVAHQSPIIDEFDTIHHSISPFLRSLSGAEFRDTINDAYDFVGSELWLCSFSGKSAKTECGHSYRTFDRHISLLVNKLFGDLPGAIPDVKFLFNHLDEPRVLLPAKIGKVYGKRQFRITDLTHQSNFDTLTRFCASHKKDKPSRKGYQVEPFGLPFVTDRDAAMDLCQHPEYANMHGLFMSPSSLPLIEGLVPVLSTGAPSTMGDILFPTPAYMESEFLFDESRDVDWDSKNNIVYWAGSTTGGFADKPGQWRFFQRQRFVEFVQKLKGRTYMYLRGQGGAIKSVASSFLNGRLYDVAFTRFLHCDRKYCHEQSLYFRTKSWADKDAPLKSKLVFDLDGNGISGRYYKLVASKSAPLKQTLLREWHDDRLIPWVHFIPVSQSMEELPELVFYLTSTDAGQKQAKEIADQGREWYRKAFREIDMTIYTYRLLLELARLQDPMREADL